MYPHDLVRSHYDGVAMDSLFWCTPMNLLDLAMVELLYLVYPPEFARSYYGGVPMDSLFWCTPMNLLDLTMVELLWIVCSGVPP